MNKKHLLILLPLLLLASCGANNNSSNNSKSEAITGLKATGIDSGIVLNWKAADNADSYVIYNGDEIYRETDNNFFTVNFLDNASTYHLGVAAKFNDTISDVVYLDAKPEAGKDYDPFIEDLNTSLEKRIGNSKINTFLQTSNANSNNTNVYRLKNVINKMQNGESQTIAYIGGSITVGETAKALDDNNHQKGYAYYSYKWLQEHYDKNNNSKFINASISGTDTCIATVRLEQDVLVNKPNLVFVEFCANNSTSLFDMKTYESLIRRILEQDNNPAVVTLFSAVDYGGTNQNSYARPIGDYYHLPMYSCLNGMEAICENISQSRTDSIFKFFTDDGVHPNDQGHKLYAKGLVYNLKNLINSDKDDTSYEIPNNPWREGYDCYTNLTYVNNKTNNNIITNLGSFVASDTSHRVLKDTADVVAYQNGWKKTAKDANEAMVIKVKCKSFFIIYFAGNPEVPGDPEGTFVASYQNDNDASDKGSLNWLANKTQKQSDLKTINDNGKGWGNPCCIILMDNDVANDYTINIKMANTSETGTLLAFGYTD